MHLLFQVLVVRRECGIGGARFFKETREFRNDVIDESSECFFHILVVLRTIGIRGLKIGESIGTEGFLPVAKEFGPQLSIQIGPFHTGDEQVNKERTRRKKRNELLWHWRFRRTNTSEIEKINSFIFSHVPLFDGGKLLN